ncbi:MAG: DUF488 family protein [Ktedonobacteraceae bacterium]
MPHTIYSIGYLNPDSLTLLQERVALGSLILDIRLVAASRWRPEFSGKRLRERFGSAYQRIRDLGNNNYNRPDEPIVLHSPEWGLFQLFTLLEQQDLCLLCRCQQLAQCHTAVVLAEVLRRDPAIPVIRLGEETRQ